MNEQIQPAPVSSRAQPVAGLNRGADDDLKVVGSVAAQSHAISFDMCVRRSAEGELFANAKPR